MQWHKLKHLSAEMLTFVEDEDEKYHQMASHKLATSIRGRINLPLPNQAIKTLLYYPHASPKNNLSHTFSNFPGNKLS